MWQENGSDYSDSNNDGLNDFWQQINPHAQIKCGKNDNPCNKSLLKGEKKWQNIIQQLSLASLPMSSFSTELLEKEKLTWWF